MEKDHHQVVTPTCPRCGSSNTKFCYYNNYSLTQPRYFCKGCRRYWTRGGSLRNVPIGGGCRKSRRGKSIRIPSDVSSKSLGQNGVESSSSFSAVCNDAVSNSSIDLAEVYANFLHPNPRQETNQVEASLPELPERINNVPHSFDQFSGFQGLNLSTLPHQGISTGFLDLSETNHLIRNETAFGYSGNIDQSTNKQHFANGNFFSSLNSSTNNFVLPPLPDAVVSEGLLWPSSSMMLPNEMLHSTNPTTTRVVDVPAGQNSEVLINASNVNPFSPLSLEAIFRS